MHAASECRCCHLRRRCHCFLAASSLHCCFFASLPGCSLASSLLPCCFPASRCCFALPLSVFILLFVLPCFHAAWCAVLEQFMDTQYVSDGALVSLLFPCCLLAYSGSLASHTQCASAVDIAYLVFLSWLLGYRSSFALLLPASLRLCCYLVCCFGVQSLNSLLTRNT